MPETPVARLTTKPTSLKLPTELKSQLEEVAQRTGMSAHAFMVKAIADTVRAVQLRESFAQDSTSALLEMKASGMGHELSAVRAYFSQLKEHKSGAAAKPSAPQPTRMT